MTSTVLIALALILLAACVFVWPTQLITDNQNRWLRIAAIAALALQAVMDRIRVEMIPAYLVGALFALLLVAGPGTSDEPSRIRESKESVKKKLLRWAMVAGSGGCILVAAYLSWGRDGAQL